jgi:hypothetical protein
VLAKGLEATEASWPEIRMAFGWARRLAAVLANKKGLDAATVRRRYRGVIAASARHRGKLGTLTEAFDHFRKVTRSCWPGLLRCYGVADLPRTNNDLEQFFGSYRYHEQLDPVAAQLAGQTRGARALGEAAENQHQLHRPALRPLQRRAGVRVEDAAATPATILPQRVAILAMDSHPIDSAARGVFQSRRMQPPHQLVVARLRVHQVGDREIHGGPPRCSPRGDFGLPQNPEDDDVDQAHVTESPS